MNYYNEYDKKAAAWLRELINARLIPAGTVDERSIVDVEPEEIAGFTQCHFFAGIGGWSLALQLAGVGPDEHVWTGSCPCQPFSSAGKGKGADDERHLWPEFARLIRECKPATVFGEQVASKAGREWFDGVSTDLEDMGYAAAAADLCAAGVNAPHIRQRLFWVADSSCTGLEGRRRSIGTDQQQNRQVGALLVYGGESHNGLGDTNGMRQPGECWAEVWLGHSDQARESEPSQDRPGWDNFDLIRCVEPTKEPGRFVEKRRRVEPGTIPLAYGVSGRVGLLRGYGNAIVPQVAAEFIQAYMETQQ